MKQNNHCSVETCLDAKPRREIANSRDQISAPSSCGFAIAYLVNQYPQPSHTFIRREIAALEALGLSVTRFALRNWNGNLVDKADEDERMRTKIVLQVGVFGLLCAMFKTFLTAPRLFLSALRLAILMGRRSNRGVGIHLIYLSEACVLKGWLVEGGIRHLHVHFGTNSAAVAMLCRVLGGPPYSLTIHGPEEFDAPQALSLAEKVHHSDFVVAVSEFGRSQICRWSKFSEWKKIRVVHCGVDKSFFSAKSTPVPSSPRLVCVGRLAEQKGQVVLVHAAALLRDRGINFELVLVGDGLMRGMLERLIDELDLHEQVKLLGWKGGDCVRREILASRALVLPSFAEGLPVVLMEALALGRPVISTWIAGIPELVLPDKCGWLIPPGSVEALADAMSQSLAMAPSELQEMGRHGAALVAKRHNVMIEAAKLADFMSHDGNLQGA